MQIEIPLAALAVFVAALVGGALPLVRAWSSGALHALVAFAAGVFLGTVFLHLLPEIADSDGGAVSPLVPWMVALAGFLALFFVERVVLERWHASGHGALADRADHPDHESGHRVVGYAAYLGLALHAAVTGLGLAATGDGRSQVLESPIVIALVVHKATESFSLVAVLRLAERSVGRTVLLLVLFCAITPACLWFGGRLLADSEALRAAARGLAVGTFLYVAVCNLLPEVFHDTEHRRWPAFGVLLGVVFVALVPDP